MEKNTGILTILIINESFTMGGAQSASIELANSLSENDNVSIHFAAGDGPLRERLRKEIVVWNVSGYTPKKALKILFRYILILIKVKPDIIHVHSGTLLGLCCFASILTMKKPAFVFTHHSQKFTRLPPIASMLLINLACRKVIAVSKTKRDQLIRLGIKRKKIELIPNFIDTKSIAARIEVEDVLKLKNELCISQNALVITMTGRLVNGKNHVQFISVLKKCSKYIGEKIVGIIVGDGGLRSDLQKLAESNETETKFIFTGFSNDVYRYLAITDIFLFPSEYEILPIVLLEAAACGLPLVCSEIPGNKDIVTNGINGYLVKGKDEDYVNAIKEICCNTQLRKRMGEESKRISKELFDKEIIVKKYMQLYNKII